MKKLILAALAVAVVLSLVACGKKNDEKITNDTAISAIKKYCYSNFPDLEEMEKSGQYTISWDVESSSDKEIVVAYRSYTGAITRYYIDASTGDTYVTEFMPGITEKEERTSESFNVKKYMGN